MNAPKRVMGRSQATVEQSCRRVPVNPALMAGRLPPPSCRIWSGIQPPRVCVVKASSCGQRL